MEAVGRAVVGAGGPVRVRAGMVLVVEGQEEGGQVEGEVAGVALAAEMAALVAGVVAEEMGRVVAAAVVVTTRGLLVRASASSAS
jgi:hypothetical protein